MSTELAIYGASVPDRMRYADALSGASLLPDAYRGKPANVLLALEYGSALGIPPMVAIQQVHIIQGRPVASAQLIGALVRKAGHRLRVSGDDRRAVCEIVRADDPEFTFRSEWTIERATAAKLTGKDTWRQYPANMLRARAITECARDACPEALAGVSYTAEELGDDTLPAESYPMTDDGAAPSAPGPEGTAPSSPAIADAVIVDDATGEVLDPGAASGGEAAAAPDYPPGHDRTTGAPIAYGPGALIDTRSSHSKRMYAQLRERVSADKMSQLAWCSEQVGRPLASSAELTQAEQSRLLDALDRLPAS